MKWMNLEPVIQSEVSHKEKNKYSILKHVHPIQKNGIDELLQGRNADVDTENEHVDIGGEGKSGTNGESSTNIYILVCVKQIAGEKLLYNTAWYSVMTQRGGLRGGIGGSRERYMYNYG